MTHSPYPYDHIGASRYTFTSIGKREITKVVDFTPTNIKGMVNLGFGDLLPNGTVSNLVISNNGDIRMVLTTLVEIIKIIPPGSEMQK